MNMNTVEIQANREPWLIPLEQRINTLFDAHRQGKKVELMVYDHPDTSTFRYRCYNLYQWSKESKKWQAVYFYREELDSVYPLIEFASILTLVRLQWFHDVDKLIYMARVKGIPVLYDVDDRVFDLDALPLLTNSIDVDFSVAGQYEYWFSYVSRNGFTAGKVDGFTTTNDYLGSHLSRKFMKPYQVIPNTLNHEQLLVSENCCKVKQHAEKQKGRHHNQGETSRFAIGYFSGSPSHNHDLALIAPELALFLDKHKNAVLYVVGFMEMAPALQPAAANGQIITMPLTDFLQLQVFMAKVQVNIVPLLENAFTNCKSELKFFEAAVVDTLTVASPIYSYAHCIRDGENGYLCSPGQWYTRLEEIYQHYSEQRDLISRAHQDALQQYAGMAFVQRLDAVLDSFTR